MPACDNPSTQARTTPGRSWIVEGKLVQAIWRTEWILLHVEISREEADAIEAACVDVIAEAFPGTSGEAVESPVNVVDGKLCLKSWGRQIGTIRNKDDEELVSVRAGAKVALRVMMKPYRDPARGLRVTAFPMRLDVRKPAPKPRPVKGKKALAEERARNVAERAAAKAAARKPVQAPKPVKPPRAPGTMPTAANLIPISNTKH
ncbi:hypothetical protein [Methylobacterium sp. B1]|uniref:hypothetical protein n=1 Tax=Methylobacterium sp. B1 TaxID=91459 RepID=UPI00034DEF98|nr:hypothetical protein [Methylobacterium sp. B1]